MSLYRGAGGASDATDDSTVNAVAGYASAAASSASTAATSATNASNSATAAASSASGAASSASSVATNAANASSSAGLANTYATAANSSKDAAAASAVTASTKAGEASTSASNAATSASTATTKASEAATSATNAANSASASASSAASALAIYGNTAAVNAAVAASAASATSSAAYANEANQILSYVNSSRDEATAAADDASAWASASQASSNDAQGYATAALSARDATLAAYDSFDDRYLGVKPLDPSTDNDGNPLIAGTLYFNQVSGMMKLYTGTAWVAAYTSGGSPAFDNVTIAGSTTLSGLTANRIPYLNASKVLTTDASSLTYDGSGNMSVSGFLTAGSLSLSNGTANGVPYLNASKIVVTSTALTFNGTSLSVPTGNISLGGTTTGTYVDVFNGDAVNAQRLRLTTSGTDGVIQVTRSSGTIPNLIFKQDSAELMRLTSTGLGIGTSSPTNALSVSGNANITGNTTLGDASTDTVAVNGYMGVGIAPNSTIALYARGTALTGTTQTGVYSYPTATSAATVALRSFSAQPGTADAVFTVANVAGFYAFNPAKGAASTITNAHGLYIADQTTGTNNYGITSLVSSGTDKWNIYASGTANNYFAGNLGIGTTSPATKLDVVGTSTFQGDINITAATPSLLFSVPSGGLDSRIYNDGSGNLIFGNGTNSSTPTERMRINASGNLGLGVTPATWFSTARAIQVGLGAVVEGRSNSQFVAALGTNYYLESTGAANTYIATGAATKYQQITGTHQWLIAPSGSINTAITFTQAMTLDSSGNLLVGMTAPATSSAKTIHLANATVPTANPTGGGVLYVEDGALKYRGSSGTVTTIAAA